MPPIDFAALFDLAPNAYMLLDRALRFVAVNQAYVELTATPREAMIGRGVFEAFPSDEANPDDPAVRELRASFERVLETGKRDTVPDIAYTLPTQTPGGIVLRQRHFSATHTPLLDPAGRVQYILQHTIDTTDLHLFRERELASEQRFLAHAIPAQVWSADPAGALTYVNEQVSTYFGRDPADVLEHGWRDGIHPVDLEAVLQRWTRSLESGEPYEIEFRLRRADAVFRWHIARALPMRDTSGAIVKWYGTNTDIDDHKRLAEERDLLISALERSNKELDSFVYVASHDLKAPLRGITNIAEWLQADLAEALNEQSRGHLDMLRRRVAHMSALIDGVLRYSRAGRLGEARQDVAVGGLLRRVVDLLAPPEGATIDVAEGMPSLHTTEVALQQVFLNLIGNALKHAKRTDVRVAIGVRDADECWVFSVTDNGPGIAPQHRERVWSLFQTLPSMDAADNTGIGLSIVRKTVAARRGTAWIEASSEAGTTFSFSWPKRET